MVIVATVRNNYGTDGTQAPEGRHQGAFSTAQLKCPMQHTCLTPQARVALSTRALLAEPQACLASCPAGMEGFLAANLGFPGMKRARSSGLGFHCGGGEHIALAKAGTTGFQEGTGTSFVAPQARALQSNSHFVTAQLPPGFP
jgi:hypothetical protein